jgi:hypothetical protein
MSKLDLKEPLAYEALRIEHFNECVKREVVTKAKFDTWLEKKEKQYMPKSCFELLELIQKNGRCSNNDHKAIKE